MPTGASCSSAPLAGPWTDAETKALLEVFLFHRGQSKSSLFSNPEPPVHCSACSGIIIIRVQKYSRARTYTSVAHHLINPRRACAARVTVVVLRVCVCVCVCVSTTILGLQATRRLMSDTNSFSATRASRKNNVAILLKRLRSRDMA